MILNHYPCIYIIIFSDGSDAASLVALKASTDLEAAAALLAGAEEEDLELAEQRMEDALEALLDAEIAGNEDDGMVSQLSVYWCSLRVVTVIFV